eukprot:CAMPEP_0180804094 /NCGR_PEP_ID=MMETSP1038_2-20121128/61271_1 /TAXON_ID=632150 /ORGANISM="Azadinium spinosum, Strain 3D9" /LENGTH=164 /DNA_ID=CAMNT_0022844501 /DNA_START=1 /DNA_END=492 /DNA_ORIENTATION=-
MAENSERHLFCKEIEERTLRFETEFRMSEMAGRLKGPAPSTLDRFEGPAPSPSTLDVPPSLIGSLPLTTVSARIFGNTNASQQDFMDRIYSVGKEEHWLLGTEELQLRPSQLLGVGGFGGVIIAGFQETVVAVKVRREQTSFTPASISDIANELRVLRKLRHPN